MESNYSPEMQELLPGDPDDLEVVVLPDEVDGGSITKVNIYLNTEEDEVQIGEATQLTKIPNISKLWAIGRSITTCDLHVGDTLTVRIYEIPFKSLQFVNGLGWVGHEIDDDAALETYNLEASVTATAAKHTQGDLTICENLLVERTDNE